MEPITINGRTYEVTVERDEGMSEPWKEGDGYGIVSEWTTRDKRAGELVLASDRRSRRYYDYAGTLEIAKRDGWGFLPGDLVIARDIPSKGDGTACGGSATCGQFTAYDPENFNRAISEVYAAHRATMTAKQYAHGAVMRDYENLKAWCNDEWEWVYVKVEGPDGEFETLGGIESTAGKYLEEVAQDLAWELDSAWQDKQTEEATL